MKKIILYFAATMLLMTAVTQGQNKVMQVHSGGNVVYGINTLQVDSITFATSLVGIKWKLAGIVDAQTGDLTELVPTDCDECYTLIFDANDTFSGQITNNVIVGSYEIDYDIHALHFSNIGGTEAIDVGDGELYRQILWEVQSFIVKDAHPRVLHLYYNDSKKYLKFEEIGG